MASSLKSLLLAVLDSTGTNLRTSPPLVNRQSALRCRGLIRKQAMRRRRRRRSLIEAGCVKPTSRLERRIRALRKLVPATDESDGLVGLFAEAVDYIACLRMQVEAMQAMVKKLS